MSTTIQIALIIFVLVVLAVDILNIRKNSQLQVQINMCSDLHRQLLSLVIDQGDTITTELDKLNDDIWDNKVEKLLIKVIDLEKSGEIEPSQYRNQILEAYREQQAEYAAKIKYIKRKQISTTEKMKSILDINQKCECVESEQ